MSNKLIVRVPTLGRYDDQEDNRSHVIPALMLVADETPTAASVYESIPANVDVDAVSAYVAATNEKWRTLAETPEIVRPW